MTVATLRAPRLGVTDEQASRLVSRICAYEAARIMVLAEVARLDASTSALTGTPTNERES